MINNVVLMGRLTAAPDLKMTQSGTSVVNFTIAIERRFQQAGAEKQTDFINCTAWRNTAEFIEKYFNKGDMIAVTGEIQTRKYEKDGQSRTVTEIVVNNASFCGGKGKGDTVNNNTPPAEEKTYTIDTDFAAMIADDDLPF